MYLSEIDALRDRLRRELEQLEAEELQREIRRVRDLRRALEREPSGFRIEHPFTPWPRRGVACVPMPPAPSTPRTWSPS